MSSSGGKSGASNVNLVDNGDGTASLTVGALTIKIPSVAAPLAAVAVSGAGTDLVSPIGLAQAPPGMVFQVDWDGAEWQFAGTTTTVRPSTRTDLRMEAVANNVAPTFADDFDVWLEDSS